MPVTFLEQLKVFLWKLFEPLFPSVRDTWVFFGFIKHNQRQRFLLGKLRTGATERQLRQHLLGASFSNDYLGWVDPDEMLNMRKVVDTIYQYHVRLHKDGEVRGHHEYTTESHPLKHLKEVGMTDGGAYLTPLLAGLLQAPPQSAGLANPTPHQPHSAAYPKSGSGANR